LKPAAPLYCTALSPTLVMPKLEGHPKTVHLFSFHFCSIAQIWPFSQTLYAEMSGNQTNNDNHASKPSRAPRYVNIPTGSGSGAPKTGSVSAPPKVAPFKVAPSKRAPLIANIGGTTRYHGEPPSSPHGQSAPKKTRFSS